MNPPANELVEALRGMPPGRALDLACGSGRHALWLRDNGWTVRAVDRAFGEIVDLESDGFAIEPEAWDLIVCWLYWQENLLLSIADGVRTGGVVSLAGKTSGRFATSLKRYQQAFAGWEVIDEGEDGHKAFYIARKPVIIPSRG